jgi:hypothetical protein
VTAIQQIPVRNIGKLVPRSVKLSQFRDLMPIFGNGIVGTVGAAATPPYSPDDQADLGVLCSDDIVTFADSVLSGNPT